MLIKKQRYLNLVKEIAIKKAILLKKEMEKNIKLAQLEKITREIEELEKEIQNLQKL